MPKKLKKLSRKLKRQKVASGDGIAYSDFQTEMLSDAPLEPFIKYDYGTVPIPEPYAEPTAVEAVSPTEYIPVEGATIGVTTQRIKNPYPEITVKAAPLKMDPDHPFAGIDPTKDDFQRHWTPERGYYYTRVKADGETVVADPLDYDRKLNEQLWERLFPDLTTPVYFFPDNGDPVTVTGRKPWIQAYSLDMGNAWTVVRAMIDRGWTFSLTSGGVLQNHAVFSNGKTTVARRHEKAPRAIAEAALAALKMEDAVRDQ